MIFKENVKYEEVKKLLMGKGSPLERMLDVAIFIPQFPNHYSVLARDTNDEQKLCLLNIWKHGTFMFDTKIFPLNRLRNMNGKNLIATTFEKAPNVYKDENNQLTGYEARLFLIRYYNHDQPLKVKYFQMKILNDLAKGRNFTYTIVPESDGKKWGWVSTLKNGSEEYRGIVGDVAVNNSNTYYHFFSKQNQLNFEFQREMTDIGFQNFLVTPDRYKWIDFLNPYASESICFMAPKTNPGFTQIFETLDLGS